MNLFKAHTVDPPFKEKIPANMWFRVADMPPDSIYPYHRHGWGEFVYSYRGIMEVKLNTSHLTTPSCYGIWLPPNIEHQGLNRQTASHCSFYLMPELCKNLPQTACTLEINSLTQTILEYLRFSSLQLPITQQQERILMVLRDQLEIAPRHRNFLPYSDDPQLKLFLKILEKNISQQLTLKNLADQHGMTLRTLNRKSQSELGLSLNEWWLRLKVIKATQLLQQGEKVEIVAFELGYSSASAFIAMFHKMTSKTPHQLRSSFL